MSSEGNKPVFIEWIGLRRNADYTKAKWLGPIVGVLLLLIAVAAAIAGIMALYRFLTVVFQTGADHEAIRNIGLVAAAVLAAPFVWWRAVVAQKQANTAEQSHITDQINKAVAGLGAQKTVDRIGRPTKINSGKSQELTHQVADPENFNLPPRSQEIRRCRDTVGTEPYKVYSGLLIDVRTWEEEHTEIEWQNTPLELMEGEAIAETGAWSVFSETQPNIEVRVGAIYALERIAQDSPRDHIQIMEILCAYIRENAPVRNLKPSEDNSKPVEPRTDIQTALDVIGRRNPEQIATEHFKKYRLDLRTVNLSGANFSAGNFEGAVMYNSRLEASFFQQTNLRAAKLHGCLLNHADFSDADLCGAQIDYATINKLGDKNGSVFFAKNIHGLSMIGSDISAIRQLKISDTQGPTFGTMDTKLHIDLIHLRIKRSDDIDQFLNFALGTESEIDIEARNRLRDAGFEYWSPFGANDMRSHKLHAYFRKTVGLKGFPFDDL